MSQIWAAAILLIAGAIGGLAAAWINLPMPYLIGSLLASAIMSIIMTGRTGLAVQFPQVLRMVFIAVVGTIIGATFSPDVLALLPSLWLSLLAVLGFVICAQFAGYQIFRRLGGYSKTNALFAAMPGGLVEAVLLGEKAGGDTQLLSVQHFCRVILVVIVVPFLFLIFDGNVVGSAAGQQFEAVESDLKDIAWIIGLSAIGVILGKLARLPAGHMMGPLIITALLHSMGIADLNSPAWLLNLAQLVIGAALGSQFSGENLKVLPKAFGLCCTALIAVLGIAFIFAVLLTPFMPFNFEVLFVSFTPGGVTEMSLIALSLQINPLVVAVHHLLRIFVTVVLANRISKWRYFQPD